MSDKDLDGWSVLTRADGSEWLVETESGALYGGGVPVAPNDAPEEAPSEKRDANLQDYWRADPQTGRLRTEDELIDAGELILDPKLFPPPHAGEVRPKAGVGGESAPPPQSPAATAPPHTGEQKLNETYHIAHLPLAYADGAQTPKATWKADALDAIVNARLKAAKEPQWERGRPKGVDQRAQFQGGVWLRAPHPIPGQDGPIPFSVDFSTAFFQGYAFFDNAAFQGYARFDNAAFQGYARFDNAAFQGYARFDNAAFQGYARFDNAAFQGYASFYNALFKRFAWFLQTRFEKRIVFQNALFEGVAEFAGITWPTDAQHWHRAFQNARFAATPSFENDVFGLFARFDGALFERGILFANGTEKQGKKVLLQERAEALKAAKAEYEEWLAEETKQREKKSEPPPTRKERDEKLKNLRNQRLRELAGGCRVLKQAMAFASDPQREQQFYRYELLAQRAQTDLGFGVKTSSLMFSLFSDYGASVARPFFALLITLVVFAGLYAYLEHGLAPFLIGAPTSFETLLAQNELADTFAFSFSRVFPFGAFENVSTDWFKAFEERFGGWTLLARTLATIQSLLAITLAFLFGLAVRRRFQIS